MSNYITETYLDENATVRFVSNDRIPFTDYLQANTDLDTDELKEHDDLRQEENMKWINEVYVPGQAARTDEQKAEEAFELRAAFGPGEKIVNVITGEVSYS